MIAAGASSTLTANCSPAATSFEWSGGTCARTTSSSCTVKPSVTTPYSVLGINADGASTVAASTAVFTGGPHDGIYQWDPGYYLSVHQINADTLIGTIYWVYTSDTVKVGTRSILNANTFDLFHGQTVGSNATMSGTVYFRACELKYDFIFNSNSTLTVRRVSVGNSPEVSVADVDCAAKYNSVDSVRNITKVL